MGVGDVGDATSWWRAGDVFGGAESWFLARRSRIALQARRAAFGMTKHVNYHTHMEVVEERYA